MSTIRNVIVAAGLSLSSLPAFAQTTTVVNGYPVRPDYQRYSTTGAPNGFAIPNVGLQRPGTYNTNQPSNLLTPLSGSNPAANVQNTPVPATPVEPENPKALETGRVKTDSTKAVSIQEPAASVAAVSKSSSVKYTPGQVISGKAKVFDGHSLLIDGNAIRLDGADAPGAVQTCTSGSGTAWRCGEAAYRRLVELTADHKIICRVTEQVGDGAAAICATTGVSDLAAVLVRDGLAVPNGHDHGRYGAAVNAARAGKTGMWEGSFTLPSKWRAANSATARQTVITQ